MNRYKTITNKEIRDTARALGISEEELRLEMEKGESILDNPPMLDKIIKATGKTRETLEKESFKALLNFIKIAKGEGKEIPESLKKKWEEPWG